MVNNFVYQFVGSNQGVEIPHQYIIVEGTLEKGCLEIKNCGFSVHFVLGFQENST